MDDHDALVDRLRDLGRQPVEPATASRHLSEMAAAPSGHSRLWTRLKIGAAFAAGLIVGGTGLASAGALPGPAQDAARTTLSKVGVNVPHGTERFNDPAVCGLDPSTQKPFRNHGQYVKAHKGDPAAAQSRCGKPLTAGTEAEEAPTGSPADPGARQGNGNGNNGNGKGHGKNKNKDKSKGGEEGKQGPEDTAPGQGPAPTFPGPTGSTTVAPQPTTTLPPSTTTLPPSTTSTTAPR